MVEAKDADIDLDEGDPAWKLHQAAGAGADMSMDDGKGLHSSTS
jgi:hypothetical protein